MGITQFSQKLATSMYEYSKGDVSISKLRYGIETILTGGIKLGTFLGISIYLGVFDEMLLALSTFIPLRLVSGGAHLSTYLRCLIAGGTWFLLSSVLSQNYLTHVPFSISLLLIIIICYTSLLICIKHAPNSHGYRKIEDRKQRKLKRLSIGFILVYSLVVLSFVLSNHYNHYIFVSLLALALQSWNIHPLAKKVLRGMDHWLDRFKGGESHA